jgi:hypothetical protein
VTVTTENPSTTVIMTTGTPTEPPDPPAEFKLPPKEIIQDRERLHRWIIENKA